MMQAAPGRHTGQGGHDGHARPRFRQDLLAELVDEQGGRFIDVMDPDSGTLFRFYEVEFSLACGMDGERDVPGIVKWAQEELGLSPSQQEVHTVIAALVDLGFISVDGVAPAHAADRGTAADMAPPARAAAPAGLGMPPGGAPVAPPPSPVAELAPAAPEPVAKRPAPPAPAQPALEISSLDMPTLDMPALDEPALDEPTPDELVLDEPAPDEVALAAPARRPAAPTPSAPVAVRPTPVVPSAPEAVTPQVSEVSIDLSDHIEVRPDDVKEAVRASRVMAAVDVPEDVLEVIADAPTSRAPSVPLPSHDRMFESVPEIDRALEISTSPPAGKPPEAAGPMEVSVETKIGKASVTKQAGVTSTAKPPVELPAPPIAKPVAPPAPDTRVSPAVVVLLILVVLGGAAFVVWKYVLEKHDAKVDTSAAPAPTVVKPAPPPPPPPAPEAKIAMETPSPDEIKTPRAGVIETILADKTVVKSGDVIVRLSGDRPIEAEITGATNSVKRLQAQIEAISKRLDDAQAANNKAGQAAAEKDLAERKKVLAGKQELVTTKSAELETFLVHAPGDGTFAPIAKPGLKVAENAVVAKVQREAIPSATFKVADEKLFAVNASIEVGIGKSDQHVACTITDIQTGSVKVTCPVDPALTDGAAVTLKILPAAAAPAPEAPPPPAAPAPGAASGSAGPAK